MNIALLLLHLALLGGITLATLRMGKEWVIAWLSLVAVAMNLFVLKQITLFGLAVTATDALAVAYLLGLNLIQEFYGKEVAKRTIWISFFLSLAFLMLSQMTLAYRPNAYDLAHPHFIFLFRPMIRIVAASLLSFLIVQFADLYLFSLLRQKAHGRFLTLRTLLSLLCSQTLDTFLFAFLGLYGIVAELGHLIFLSLIVKWMVIFFSAPIVASSKKVMTRVV